MPPVRTAGTWETPPPSAVFVGNPEKGKGATGPRSRPKWGPAKHGGLGGWVKWPGSRDAYSPPVGIQIQDLRGRAFSPFAAWAILERRRPGIVRGQESGRALKRRPRSGRMLPYPPRFVFLVVRRNSTSATYEGVIALLRVNLLYKRRCFCLVLIARGSISYTWMNTSDTDS